MAEVLNPYGQSVNWLKEMFLFYLILFFCVCPILQQMRIGNLRVYITKYLKNRGNRFLHGPIVVESVAGWRKRICWIMARFLINPCFIPFCLGDWFFFPFSCSILVFTIFFFFFSLWPCLHFPPVWTIIYDE